MQDPISPRLAFVDPASAQMQALYALRHLVFVQEQRVPVALERDAYDAAATHLAAWLPSREAAGTLRMLDKGHSVKIGRVAVHPAWRRRGLASQMMRMALEEARRRGFAEAALDAQVDALALYEKLGFVAEGERFEDAGIMHLHMRLALKP